MLERLKNGIRIRKAIRETTPTDYPLELAGNMNYLFNPTAAVSELSNEYTTYRKDLKTKRAEHRERIRSLHPDWFKKAPEEKVIVDFLNKSHE
jgi:hypothetical protein